MLPYGYPYDRGGLVPDGPHSPRMIFVGGLQRSGTTLLGRLLAQHPEIGGLVGTPTSEDEGQFVQSVYLDDHVMGRRSPRTRADQPIRWAYHPEAHLTEADLPARPDAASRLLGSWGQYWDKPDAPLLLEKSPSNLTRFRFLQAAFPDTACIVITRHPVVQALGVRKWTSPRVRRGPLFGLGVTIDHWLRAMELFAADRPVLRQVKVVAFEDLVTDPARTLADVHAFLGVAPRPADFSLVIESTGYREFWARISSAATDVRGRWGRDAPADPLLPGRSTQLALGTVGPLVARVLQERYGRRVARFGYDLRNIGPPDPSRTGG